MQYLLIIRKKNCFTLKTLSSQLTDKTETSQLAKLQLHWFYIQNFWTSMQKLIVWTYSETSTLQTYSETSTLGLPTSSKGVTRSLLTDDSKCQKKEEICCLLHSRLQNMICRMGYIEVSIWQGMPKRLKYQNIFLKLTVYTCYEIALCNIKNN